MGCSLLLGLTAMMCCAFGRTVVDKQDASTCETIDLEWRPAAQEVCAGDLVNFELYAVSCHEPSPELVAVELFFTWDATLLQFVGVDDVGAVPFWFSGFIPGGPCDPNETLPPQDGDGRYNWIANPSVVVLVDLDGVLLGTFQFHAVTAPWLPTEVAMLETFETCETRIASGVSADVLGGVSVAEVSAATLCLDSGER
jgi:hypothetical protein